MMASESTRVPPNNCLCCTCCKPCSGVSKRYFEHNLLDDDERLENLLVLGNTSVQLFLHITYDPCVWNFLVSTLSWIGIVMLVPFAPFVPLLYLRCPLGNALPEYLSWLVSKVVEYFTKLDERPKKMIDIKDERTKKMIDIGAAIYTLLTMLILTVPLVIIYLVPRYKKKGSKDVKV